MRRDRDPPEQISTDRERGEYGAPRRGRGPGIYEVALRGKLLPAGYSSGLGSGLSSGSLVPRWMARSLATCWR